MESGKKTVTVEMEPSQLLTLVRALECYERYYRDVLYALPNDESKDVILHQMFCILGCTECLENSFNKILEVI